MDIGQLFNQLPYFGLAMVAAFIVTSFLKYLFGTQGRATQVVAAFLCIVTTLIAAGVSHALRSGSDWFWSVLLGMAIACGAIGVDQVTKKLKGETK